jgi:PhoH-like ATPase
MPKYYVLDTNVLLHDPNAVYSFEDNHVIIPSVALEELDSKKKLNDELGRNARHISRVLDGLREQAPLHVGVSLHNGGTLKVEFHNPKSNVFEMFLDNKNDNAIIAVAEKLQSINPDATVIMVSKDTLVRIKADIVGVIAQNYESDMVVSTEDDLYKGFSELYVEDELINSFFKEKSIKATTKQFKNYPENHFFILKSEISDKKSAVCRKVKNKLVPLYSYTGEDNVFGIHHKNVGQLMALELLMDDSVPIVSLSGKAGTGKTLLALAAGLQKTLDADNPVFNKILVARPVVPMGKDIGYLPGEKEEKLRPWMQPIFDNLEFLFNCKTNEELEKVLSGFQGEIQVEALTYIRGRSIARQLIIIDEAQNLTKHEVKTIATRLGEGSKLILVGDPDQIDHPYLDKYSNGLTYAIETLKELKETGHVTLTRGERSTIAQLCADML